MAGKRLTQIMGILNVTPDSFSDGGQFLSVQTAIEHAERMVYDGADIIDVGGASTRPGAAPVSLTQELDRVIPVIEAIHSRLSITISIDTTQPDVMTAAIAAGATMVNDVNALRNEGTIEVVKAAAVPVCLMHMQGTPMTMQQAPVYDDVVLAVKAFLQQRMDVCLASGIARENILIDPGFGFGKTLSHNIQLMQQLRSFLDLGVALLVGVSRKSMVGALLDDAPVDQRLYGSLALAVIAVWQGASIIRVHDVKATADALHVCDGIKFSK